VTRSSPIGARGSRTSITDVAGRVTATEWSAGPAVVAAVVVVAVVAVVVVVAAAAVGKTTRLPRTEAQR
jgi:hypothetical protein